MLFTPTKVKAILPFPKHTKCYQEHAFLKKKKVTEEMVTDLESLY